MSTHTAGNAEIFVAEIEAVAAALDKIEPQTPQLARLTAALLRGAQLTRSFKGEAIDQTPRLVVVDVDPERVASLTLYYRTLARRQAMMDAHGPTTL